MQRRGRDNAIVLREQWYHLIVEKPPCRNPMQQDDRLALTKIGEPQTIFRAYPLSGSGDFVNFRVNCGSFVRRACDPPAYEQVRRFVSFYERADGFLESDVLCSP
jgi:hypothetical protein